MTGRRGNVAPTTTELLSLTKRIRVTFDAPPRHCFLACDSEAMSKSIEEITEIHRRLGGLLSDPQPGLFTWCQAFRNVFKELVEAVDPPDEKKPEPQPNELTPEERDLLDAAAMLAMNGFVTSNREMVSTSEIPAWYAKIAGNSYVMADAMIAARRKRRE